MAATSNLNRDVLTKLTPGGSPGLAQLTDDELLANTRRLVGKSNQLLAALLVHLAEVEARGVHRTRRCASLYTYCIYELRFSEDAAARRSAAARLVKQFPALFEAVADGELHLTGLLMIGPQLTPENHLEVLGRAKFRTKKELAKLIRELNPLPRVPDCIEPIGPALPRTPRRPTWAEFAASLCPPVPRASSFAAVRQARRARRVEPDASLPRAQRAGGGAGFRARLDVEKARVTEARSDGRAGRREHETVKAANRRRAAFVPTRARLRWPRRVRRWDQSSVDCVSAASVRPLAQCVMM